MSDKWRHPDWRVRWRQRLRPRWRVAEMFNRLDAWCWPDLVTWALRWDVEPLLTNRRGASCRVESTMSNDRSCYCGKFVNGCRAARGVVGATTGGTNE